MHRYSPTSDSERAGWIVHKEERNSNFNGIEASDFMCFESKNALIMWINNIDDLSAPKSSQIYEGVVSLANFGSYEPWLSTAVAASAADPCSLPI